MFNFSLLVQREIYIGKRRANFFKLSSVAFNFRFNLFRFEEKVAPQWEKKGNDVLLRWSRSISNRLWWCCQECGGDEQV